MTTITRNRSGNTFPAESDIDLELIMHQVYLWLGLSTLVAAATAFAPVSTCLAVNPTALIVAIVAKLGMVLGMSLALQRLIATPVEIQGQAVRVRRGE